MSYGFAELEAGGLVLDPSDLAWRLALSPHNQGDVLAILLLTLD